MCKTFYSTFNVANLRFHSETLRWAMVHLDFNPKYTYTYRFFCLIFSSGANPAKVRKSGFLANPNFSWSRGFNHFGKTWRCTFKICMCALQIAIATQSKSCIWTVHWCNMCVPTALFWQLLRVAVYVVRCCKTIAWSMLHEQQRLLLMTLRTLR